MLGVINRLHKNNETTNFNSYMVNIDLSSVKLMFASSLKKLERSSKLTLNLKINWMNWMLSRVLKKPAEIELSKFKWLPLEPSKYGMDRKCHR